MAEFVGAGTEWTWGFVPDNLGIGVGIGIGVAGFAIGPGVLRYAVLCGLPPALSPVLLMMRLLARDQASGSGLTRTAQ